MSAPPSAAEVEAMEICCIVQEQSKSDNSLDAFLDAEEAGDDDDQEATAGSSQ